MAVPQLPPPIEMSNDTKRAIIDGVKKIVEIFKVGGRLGADANYSAIISDPRELYRFIKTYRNSTELVGDVVKDADGKPVLAEDAPLECGVTLAQVQQLLVKTCSKRFLEVANRE